MQAQFAGLHPDMCGGLSLGEYTALFASKRISFTDCLSIVAARGKYMQEACGERQGTMRVVLGMEADAVAQLLPSEVWIANLNCPGQVVIAGEASQMVKAEEALKAAGAKRVLPIDVLGAFHTPFMKSAQDKLKPLLLSVDLQDSSIGFVMNVPGNFVLSKDEIRSNLIAQVASPTRWEKCVRAMDERGIDLYIEIGPGKTLTGMNKKIGPKGMTINIEKIGDLEQLHATTQR